jgi:hypothetical protein
MALSIFMLLWTFFIECVNKFDDCVNTPNDWTNIVVD